MSERPADTGTLLSSWHSGDDSALGRLVQENLDWIRAHVRKRLGQLVRRRVDSQDIVQDTLLDLLRAGPRFVISDRQQFRALMARMVENAIRRDFDFHTAQGRDVRREARIPSRDTVLALGPVGDGATRPSEAASRDEMRALVNLALELLDPDDRLVIVRREYQQQPFAAIAAELGVNEDAARMRFQRALPKLATRLGQLRSGRIEEALRGSA